MTPRKRSETSPPTVNVGPVWFVRTMMAERYISAPTVEDAIAIFHKAVVDTGSDDNRVREVKLVALDVHAAPGMKPAKTDGH